jgi:hypothetical protein
MTIQELWDALTYNEQQVMRKKYLEKRAIDDFIIGLNLTRSEAIKIQQSAVEAIMRNIDQSKVKDKTR